MIVSVGLFWCTLDSETMTTGWTLSFFCTSTAVLGFFFPQVNFILKFSQCEAEKELSSEQRVRIMNELPKTIAEAAQKVHKAANASSAEDFLAVLEVC
jgi:hypothetical protein